jgi:hypothetical protein
MLRCNHYLEPSPQGASERKIPICLVNSVFNSRGRAPARNRRGKERQWDLPIALQIKRGRFESAPELQRPQLLSARYGLAQSIGVVGGSDKSRHKLQPAVAITRSQHSPTRKDRRTSFRARNDIVKAQRARSNPNESAAKIGGAGGATMRSTSG